MGSKFSFIVASSVGKSYRFSIHRWQLVSLIGFFCFLILFSTFSLFSNYYLFDHYLSTKEYKDTQEVQVEVIQRLKDEVHSLRNMVETLIKKEEEIRQDLGRPKYRKLSYRRRIRRKERQFLRHYPSQFEGQAMDVFNVSSQMSYLKGHVVTMERKMRRHVKVFDQYLEWFQETPSIWPVYGYIRSGYGWRVHPLKRSRQFHKGIDIPAWIGAPVQATADGYVEFSGWGGGYGWMVGLSHKFGIKTFYAHLSEVEVRQGVRVNKGQIIGKIGTSGLSTGPHVHYEIRHRRKALEPTRYLNLDLFTAVSKLW